MQFKNIPPTYLWSQFYPITYNLTFKGLVGMQMEFTTVFILTFDYYEVFEQPKSAGTPSKGEKDSKTRHYPP